jgi:hypothetical protein
VRTLESELGPHVERLTDQPRLYADANVPAGVIAFMRERLRWDVLAVVEHDELRRGSDPVHYRTARRLHRTLLSLDDDFLDDRQFPPDESGGVIILSAPDQRGLVRLLTKINRTFFSRRGSRSGRPVGQPLIGQKLEVHPDWLVPAASTKKKRRRRRRRREAPVSRP